MPALSTATPAGALKRAALPVPSTSPACPGDPARVVTTPAGVILRIVVIAEVGHIDVARAVHRHPVGAVELRRGAGAVGAPIRCAVPASVVTMFAGSDGSVENWKRVFVLKPLGLTLPLSVAWLPVIAVAASVVAPGAGPPSSRQRASSRSTRARRAHRASRRPRRAEHLMIASREYVIESSRSLHGPGSEHAQRVVRDDREVRRALP